VIKEKPALAAEKKIPGKTNDSVPEEVELLGSPLISGASAREHAETRPNTGVKYKKIGLIAANGSGKGSGDDRRLGAGSGGVGGKKYIEDEQQIITRCTKSEARWCSE